MLGGLLTARGQQWKELCLSLDLTHMHLQGLRVGPPPSHLHSLQMGPLVPQALNHRLGLGGEQNSTETL